MQYDEIIHYIIRNEMQKTYIHHYKNTVNGISPKGKCEGKC